MNVQSYRALADGLEAWGRGESRTREENMRLAALKKQQEREADQMDINRRLLKLQQDRFTEDKWSRLDTEAQRQRDWLRAETDAQWRRDPANPDNVARASQANFYDAQAAALGNKPQSPIAAQVQGMDEFADAMAKVTLENQQLLQRVQAGDQTAMPALVKSQLKLSGLSQLGQQLLKAQKPTSIVKIKRSSEDGTTSEELEVPAAEWNDQHPAWSRFNPAPGAAPVAQTAATAAAQPTPQAIQYLRANPALRAAFEQKYGSGSAAAYLR